MKIALFQILVAFFLASVFLNTFMAGGIVLVALSTGLLVGFAFGCGGTDREPRILGPIIEGNILIDKSVGDPSFKVSDQLREMFKNRIDKIMWRIPFDYGGRREEAKLYIEGLEPDVMSVYNENLWIAMSLLGEGARSFPNPCEPGKMIAVTKEFADRAIILGFLP